MASGANIRNKKNSDGLIRTVKVKTANSEY